MSKLFSIIQAINYEFLDIKLKKFISETGEQNPYIFMNEEMLKDFGRKCLPIVPVVVDMTEGYPKHFPPDYSKVKALYDGHPVYLNNDLQYGQIEIR